MPADRNFKRCSFCGKTEPEVQNLFSAGNANICDECIIYCYEMLMNNEALGYVPSPDHLEKFGKPSKALSLKKPLEIKKIMDEYIMLSFRSQTLSFWAPQVSVRHCLLRLLQRYLTFPLQ